VFAFLYRVQVCVCVCVPPTRPVGAVAVRAHVIADELVLRASPFWACRARDPGLTLCESWPELFQRGVWESCTSRVCRIKMGPGYKREAKSFGYGCRKSLCHCVYCSSSSSGRTLRASVSLSD
jgi:hypothetical protein